METPHRKTLGPNRGLNPRPSCCEAAMLTQSCYEEITARFIRKAFKCSTIRNVNTLSQHFQSFITQLHFFWPKIAKFSNIGGISWCVRGRSVDRRWEKKRKASSRLNLKSLMLSDEVKTGSIWTGFYRKHAQFAAAGMTFPRFPKENVTFLDPVNSPNRWRSCHAHNETITDSIPTPTKKKPSQIALKPPKKSVY